MLRRTGHTSCDVEEDLGTLLGDVKEDWDTLLVMLRRTGAHFL
jgi:hypothetical protein